MKLEICNSDYIKSHGKNPSGFGSWAFNLYDGSTGKVVDTKFAPSSSLREAKVWLRWWVNANMDAELQTGLLFASVAP